MALPEQVIEFSGHFGELDASSRSSSLREDHGPAVHSRHGHQAILSRSSENEKQRFTRSGNLYGHVYGLLVAISGNAICSGD